MVMDNSLTGLYCSVNGLKLDDETFSALSDDSMVNQLCLNADLVSQNYGRIPSFPPDLISSNSALSFNRSQNGESHEDFDFSDLVLKYINEMLMEEDMEEKTCMFQESSAALHAAEKSLYELIGQTYPPAPNTDTVSHLHDHIGSPDEKHDSNYSVTSSTNGSNSDPGWSCDLGEYSSTKNVSQSTSQSYHGSSNSTGTYVDGFVDSPISASSISEFFSDSESIMHFKKGFEEASKFIPSGSLFSDLKNNGFLKGDMNNFVTKSDEKFDGEYTLDGLRGKKNRYPESLNLETGRSSKQFLVHTESTLSPADFDRILLNSGQGDALREALQNEKSKNAQHNVQVRGPRGGKVRGKKQGGKKNVVDLRTLLTLCAQAVAADDRRSANDFLEQIRQNASRTGDDMQRMALIFADGLEARMAGSGTKVYRAVLAKPSSAAEILKAYHLFLAACPFRKVANFFSNKTIMNSAEKATKLHIVDFGIMYGFQWPCLIQRLSSRSAGPPHLRITGIDLPNPGFRPAERVEETGHRLANYARTFKVPFQFNAIARKWDTIELEDLKIDENEVLVVNINFRLRNLLDETVLVESPRNIVLNLIRRMNPDVFVVSMVNGAYNAPFFLTRFREALFYYSTLFDMLENNVPREIPERELIEREIFGREAMNVIACEGAERIERPETYKQSQIRIARAGFKQLPLNEEILTTAKKKVKVLYHKDFVTDEDSQWLLQGWKGRIVSAHSTWKPDSSSWL